MLSEALRMQGVAQNSRQHRVYAIMVFIPRDKFARVNNLLKVVDRLN